LDNERYAYAVGRVRAMERGLLDRSRIDRMVEASSAEEALKVLGETAYAEYLSALNSIFDYDRILERELHRIYLEMRRFSPEPELVGLFACKFDYHNLKVLFKALKMGEKRDDLLVKEAGNLPLALLVRAVSEDNFIYLPSKMSQAAVRLAEAFRLEVNPQLVDLVFDGAMFEEIFEKLEIVASPFLTKYFQYLVDLTNIKTFLRVKRANQTREFLEQALLPFGTLDLRRLVQLGDPLEVLVDRLMTTEYAQVVEDGIQTYQRTDSLTRYEKLADNFLLRYLKKAKYVTFGPEPLAAYLLAKENEIKLIRIIMVGKINQLPNEEIKERLRDVYV